MKYELVTASSQLESVTSEAEDIGKMDGHLSRRILFLIDLINAFEQSVNELKEKDCVWGPVHLSIGQEAAAAACISALDRGDKISGSHRAHHISLAKIVGYYLPVDWDPVDSPLSPEAEEAVYRTLAEIMGLAPGYCGGRGGSMHLRNMDAGVLGTNAIVAGGVPLSVGAAFAEKWKGGGGVIAAFLGDGAVNQGSFHEACNLANLWKLPILFVIENNQYAVATSVHNACSAEELVQLALGYGMTGYQAAGYDVLALFSVMETAAASLRDGGKPILLEVKGYRHFHHGGGLKGSSFGYRSAEEEDWWLAMDARSTYPNALQKAGILGAGDAEKLRTMAEEVVQRAVSRCTVDEGASIVKDELWPPVDSVAEGVRSRGRELEGLPYRSSASITETVSLKYSDAIAAVTGRWLEKDKAVIVLGEEVANFGGGAYGATKGLPKRFPGRVINTPISEAGFCGAGLGAAMNGLKPVIEIMFPDFTLVAADQVFNQIGKARYMYGNTTDLPIVMRTRVASGCGYGGQHSMDPVGLFALFSGWRICAPADSYEFIGLFNTAMHSLDPVLIIEHHALYGDTTEVPADDLDYCIPFGMARIVRKGSDMTVAVYGSMVERVSAIADKLAREPSSPRAVDIEIIDLRCLDRASIDYRMIGSSLEKTGVFATVEQTARGLAIGDRIAARITEQFFDCLDAPPGVLTALDVPNAVSRKLEEAAMLSDETIERELRNMALRKWK
jgi:2-oxoisovalerate dehydrogenase E1 component